MKDLLLRKWDVSRTYAVFLLLFDICAINISSLVALMLRFNGPLNVVPSRYLDPILGNMILNTVITLGLYWILRLYKSVWRFASIHELKLIAISTFGSVLAHFVILFVRDVPMYRSYYILYGATLFILTVISRFSYRFLRYTYRAGQHSKEAKHIMVIGGGSAGDMIMNELASSPKMDAFVECIIDDDVRKQGTYIRGVKIIGGRASIPSAVKKYDIDTIILASPSASKKTIRELLEICTPLGCDVKVMPGVYQLLRGDVEVAKLRNVEIEDLLGREEVQVVEPSVGAYVADKVVLVTGGGGSIGGELCRQVAANGPRKLVILDIYENTTYEVERELRTEYPELDLTVLIGSVRDEGRLRAIFEKYGPDIVFHAAAHKHVPLMEDSPNEAIKNNVFGTYNVCRCADEYGTARMVLISTDKAVNPTNIMGASKRLCEMIVQYFNDRSETEYAAVRFGNVLGSHGSVIPLFKKQIERGGPVTVTDPNIIRYFMTIPEAVSLVLKAGASARGGEIFVLDMGDPVKIDDLARNLIRLAGYEPEVDIPIVYTGLRPGEKLYEELLMDEEGLQSTANALIFIGRPIKMDEATFEAELKDLREQAKDEQADIRPHVQRMVTTYHIKEEDA